MATIPRQITVVRDSTGVAEVYIDGEPFPYALAADEGVSVEIIRGRVPSVRFTVLAHAIELHDDLLSDADLSHPDTEHPEDAQP